MAGGGLLRELGAYRLATVGELAQKEQPPEAFGGALTGAKRRVVKDLTLRLSEESVALSAEVEELMEAAPRWGLPADPAERTAVMNAHDQAVFELERHMRVAQALLAGEWSEEERAKLEQGKLSAEALKEVQAKKISGKGEIFLQKLAILSLRSGEIAMTANAKVAAAVIDGWRGALERASDQPDLLRAWPALAPSRLMDVVEERYALMEAALAAQHLAALGAWASKWVQTAAQLQEHERKN